MASTCLSINVVPRSVKYRVEVPDDVPLARLIPAIVNALGLPTDNSGNPISYRLDNPQTGERLMENETLAQAGIQPEAMLHLVPEVVAGGTRWSAYAG